MEKSVPRAVVFDMDGLMFNSEDIYTMVGTELMGRRGHEFTPELKRAMMGLPPQRAFETMIEWYDLDDDWEAMGEESNAIFAALVEDHLDTMPGLLALLDALEAAKRPKAIATSSVRELAEACLSQFDLLSRFSFVLTAEDITHGKPHPEIYLTAAARLGLMAHDLLVLEDSHNGCCAAAAAGAFTVAVPGDHSRDHDFSMADLVVDGLHDDRLYAVLGIAADANRNEC